MRVETVSSFRSRTVLDASHGQGKKPVLGAWLALSLALLVGWGAHGAEFDGVVKLPDGVKLTMVKIKAGKFDMGSYIARSRNGSITYNGTEVTLSQDYWLGKTEVTQEQWQAVMGKNPAGFPKGENYPVEQVSWNDAMAFCDKLNETCHDQLPRGYRFDLPTEAQWEFAARGGTKSRKFLFSGSNQLNDVGWCQHQENPEKKTKKKAKASSQNDMTHPVGKKKPNELGLYDMSGNVWEWCRNDGWTSSNDPELFNDRDDRVSFSESTTDRKRITRGGSYNSSVEECRVARSGMTSNSTFSEGFTGNFLGLRLALVVNEYEALDPNDKAREGKNDTAAKSKSNGDGKANNDGEESDIDESELATRNARPMNGNATFPEVVELNRGVKLEMVKIKAGTFMMGLPESSVGAQRRAKPRKVTLAKDFWLGKYEVTGDQYSALMGASWRNCDGCPEPNVSWEKAKEFCDKLNQMFKDKLPHGYRFDLPTEAQWEYACRAGTTTALNNGHDLTTETGVCPNLDEVGWYRNNSQGTAHAVGQKNPNAWGLYDMHGNVAEWCRDMFEDNYAKDPEFLRGNYGPDRAHVLRGGSWNGIPKHAHAAHRSANKGYGGKTIGFRLALVPVP